MTWRTITRKKLRYLADLRDDQLNDIGVKRDDLPGTLHLDIARDLASGLAGRVVSQPVKIRRRRR